MSMILCREKIKMMEEKYDSIHKKIEENRSELKRLREVHSLKKKLRAEDYKENKRRLANVRVGF